MQHFFRFSSEVLLFADEDVRGIVTRADIVHQLSDISQRETKLPLRGINGEETLLQIFEAYSITYNGAQALPLMDGNLNITAFLNRGNLLEWFSGEEEEIPEQLSEPETPAENKPSLKVRKNETVKEKQSEDPTLTAREIQAEGFSFLHDNRENELEENKTESEHSEETSQYKLAIAALETLSVPMLALDLRGGELFFNHEWQDLQRQYRPQLESKGLFNSMRDQLSASIIERGGKAATDVINLEQNLLRHNVRGRTIETDKGETLGYLIWLERKVNASSSAGKAGGKDFSGRTLPDILSDAEEEALLWAMEQAGDNQSNAALLLGIPRQTFSYKYRKHFSGKS